MLDSKKKELTDKLQPFCQQYLLFAEETTSQSFSNTQQLLPQQQMLLAQCQTIIEPYTTELPQDFLTTQMIDVLTTTLNELGEHLLQIGSDGCGNVNDDTLSKIRRLLNNYNLFHSEAKATWPIQSLPAFRNFIMTYTIKTSVHNIAFHQVIYDIKNLPDTTIILEQDFLQSFHYVMTLISNITTKLAGSENFPGINVHTSVIANHITKAVSTVCTELNIQPIQVLTYPTGKTIGVIKEELITLQATSFNTNASHYYQQMVSILLGELEKTLPSKIIDQGEESVSTLLNQLRQIMEIAKTDTSLFEKEINNFEWQTSTKKIQLDANTQEKFITFVKDILQSTLNVDTKRQILGQLLRIMANHSSSLSLIKQAASLTSEQTIINLLRHDFEQKVIITASQLLTFADNMETPVDIFSKEKLDTWQTFVSLFEDFEVLPDSLKTEYVNAMAKTSKLIVALLPHIQDMLDDSLPHTFNQVQKNPSDASFFSEAAQHFNNTVKSHNIRANQHNWTIFFFFIYALLCRCEELNKTLPQVIFANTNLFSYLVNININANISQQTTMGLIFSSRLQAFEYFCRQHARRLFQPNDPSTKPQYAQTIIVLDFADQIRTLRYQLGDGHTITSPRQNINEPELSKEMIETEWLLNSQINNPSLSQQSEKKEIISSAYDDFLELAMDLDEDEEENDELTDDEIDEEEENDEDEENEPVEANEAANEGTTMVGKKKRSREGNTLFFSQEEKTSKTSSSDGEKASPPATTPSQPFSAPHF